MTLLVGSYGTMRARAEKSNCSSNLRNLYVGAASYVQDQGHWPQISTDLLPGNRQEYASQWITALSKYGISVHSWVCPTVQRSLGNPDLNIPLNARIDYNPMPFDDRPNTAYTWPTQPWFVEHAASHDGGPLLIYTNGQILGLYDAIHLTGN